jgi:hypothetical protein
LLFLGVTTTFNRLALKSEWDRVLLAVPSTERRAHPSKERRPVPRHFKVTVAILGIDIGKNTFHLVGLNKRR